MRIAIFAESFLPKIDGVTVTVCNLLEHLALRGHHGLVFAPVGAPSHYADIPIIGLPGFNFPLYPELRLASPFVNVKQHLLSFKPDLVHLVNPAFLGLAGLWYARRFGLPVVASYHTDIPGYAEQYYIGGLGEPMWAYFRWVHNHADLNLCPSRFTQAQLLEHGFKRVKVWTHGVDTQRFNPQRSSPAWRARLSDGDIYAPLLLYVGRLAMEKRVEWLHPLIEALPGVRLAIVGDGPVRSALEDLFEGTPTVFTGYLYGDDLAHAYASADLFVFPSANETFGNVVLEAMASGLPIIAPRAGGLMDHVQDGYNGFLFDPNDLAEMVSLVKWLAWNPEHRQRLGENAYLYAQSQSWEAAMEELFEEYAGLVHQFKHYSTTNLVHRPLQTWHAWRPRSV